MKLRITIFMTILFLGSGSYALDVEQIFGNDSPQFIRKYNERLFSWLMERTGKSGTCFSDKEKKQLRKILQYWPSWGEKYGEGEPSKVLLLNFEVFYEQQGADQPITSGLRMRLPPEKLGSFRSFSGQGDTWGIEVRLSESQPCQIEALKFSRETGTVVLKQKDGRKTILRKVEGSKLLNPFLSAVGSSLAIYRDQELHEEVLFLNAYNLSFMNRAFFSIAMAHEKEFHQLPMRLKWKSESEYTVYYP